MRPVRVAVPAAGNSPVVPLDVYSRGITTMAITDVVGVININLEFTLDDVFSPTFNPATATWYPHPNGTGIAAAGAHVLAEGQAAGMSTGAAYNATAVRATNAGAGTATLVVTQGGLQT